MTLSIVGGIVADAFIPIIAVATLGGICLIGIIVVSLWEIPVGAENETINGPAD